MDELDRAVYELMGEFGTLVTYISHTEGEYDTSTGTSPTIETNYTVEGIVMDLTLASNGLSTKYGTLVEAGDKELFIRPPKTVAGLDALTVSPASDFVVVAGTKYKIVTFKEVNPTGDAAILFTLYIRR